MWKTLGMALILLFVSPGALAEDVPSRLFVDLMAFSDDGMSALLKEETYVGSERVTLHYRIVSGQGGGKSFLVSSLKNPKEPEDSEKVSSSKCRKKLKKIKRALKKHGFPETVVKDECQTRDDLVTPSGGQQDTARGCWMKEGKNSAADVYISLELRQNKLILKESGQKVKTWSNVPQYLGFKAAVSESRRLLLVFNQWPTDQQALAGVYFSRTGKASDYKEVSP